MLSASKLWKSSSISGPEATSNPARRKSVSMRSRACVTGCSPPGASPRPGSVTSMRPAVSARSISPRSSAVRRASMAACMRSFASLMRAPAAGRSAAGSVPSAFSCSVSAPFLPSQRTRASSSAARSPDAATSASASCVRAVRSAKSGLPSADAEGGLCLLRQSAERRRVVHRDVGKHLAVDLHASFIQSVDDAAVGKSVYPCGRVDARDPQRAEFALVLPPVAVRILPRLDDRLLRRTVDLAPGVVVALRLAKNFLVTASGRHATLHSCHGAARLTLIGKKLLDAAHIGVVHETRAARARLAFDLAVLVAEIVAAIRRVPLEALRCLAKTLGCGPVGFQLGHRSTPRLCSPVRKALAHPLRANARHRQPCRALLLFRCKDHDHLLAFHERVLLDHRMRSEVARNPVEELATDVLVHHLAATEPQGHLGLIAFGQEAGEITQLDLVIRLARAGTKLHFLDLNLLLLALGGVGLLVLLEQELAVVHDAHHRRLGGGRHLDQIQFGSGRHLQGVVTGHHSGLRPVGRDHTQLRRADLFVAPHPLCCTSDSLTLQRLTPSAVELDTEPFGERFRDHRAQVLAASRAY